MESNWRMNLPKLWISKMGFDRYARELVPGPPPFDAKVKIGKVTRRAKINITPAGEITVSTGSASSYDWTTGAALGLIEPD